MSMKAVLVATPGGPDVLSVSDVPRPLAGPGEIVVRVHVAGVNYIDTYHRTGAYKLPLPARIGRDGAGVVAECGEGVSVPPVGQRVAFVLAPGAYAEYVAMPAWKAVPLPPALSYDHGCAVMLQGLTAHYLADIGLVPGRPVLVTAGAGGVGSLLIQVAKLRGASVITTVSTKLKADIATRAGADHVIFYRDEDIVARVAAITGGKGVAVVYDSVGKDTYAQSLKCLSRRGHLVLYGQSSGAVPPLDPQLLSQNGSLFLTRPTLADYVSSPEELQSRASEILQWLADGKLSITINPTRFSLEKAPDAHRALEARETVGKILLDVIPPSSAN